MSPVSKGDSCILGDGWILWLAITVVVLFATSLVLLVRASLAERRCRVYANKYCSLGRLHDQVVANQSWYEGEAARLRRELQLLAGQWPLRGDGLPALKRAEIREDTFVVGDDGSASDEDDGQVTPVSPTDNEQHSGYRDTHVVSPELAEDDNEFPCYPPSPSSPHDLKRDRNASPLPTHRPLMDELQAAMTDEVDETLSQTDENEAEETYWGSGMATPDLGGPIDPLRLPHQRQGDVAIKADSKEASDKEAGDKEAGDKEAGDKEAGDKEAGDKEASNEESEASKGGDGPPASPSRGPDDVPIVNHRRLC